MNARAMRVGRASILISTAPLLYTAFILAFRNDLGVFLKYAIQLFIFALIMNLFIIHLASESPDVEFFLQRAKGTQSTGGYFTRDRKLFTLKK